MTVNDDMQDPDKVVAYLIVGVIILSLLAFALTSGCSSSSSGSFDDNGQQVYTPGGNW